MQKFDVAERNAALLEPIEHLATWCVAKISAIEVGQEVRKLSEV